MRYSVVLEEAISGGFMAWVIELPGCLARAPTRDEVEAKIPLAIRDFLQWREDYGETQDPGDAGFEIVASVVTKADVADGDTSILLDADRAPLTEAEWRTTATWLDKSRQDLLDVWGPIQDASLDWTPEGGRRSIQQTIFHLAMVEIMYAVWTFDLHSKEGLEEFLAWTRRVASQRMSELAAQSDDRITLADWAGAPEPEEWTARKAARRLLCMRGFTYGP